MPYGEEERSAGKSRPGTHRSANGESPKPTTERWPSLQTNGYIEENPTRRIGQTNGEDVNNRGLAFRGGKFWLVKRAAELQGRSISDFVVAAALEVAHRTIDEAQVIRLSVEDQERFVGLLLNPPVLAPALKRAKRAHAGLIGPSQ